jgi:cytochrome c
MVSGAPRDRSPTVAVALCLSVAAMLWSGPGAKARADLELGRHLAAECMTCHRSATATTTIPNIFGLDETHMVLVLKAYRNKELSNPVMQSIAGRLSDDEIAALALFFRTTKKP